MFVVPGDEVEDRVGEVTSTIETTLKSVGATDVNHKNLGKQRLAYPFQGRIRYGTFVLMDFGLDPDQVGAFKEKIRFVKGIARGVIRHKSAEAPEVAEQSVDLEEEKTDRSSQLEPEVAIRTAVKEEKSEELVGKKEEKPTLSQEELDKRIDELLAEEIDPENL